MADQSPSGSVEQPKSEGGSLLFSPPISKPIDRTKTGETLKAHNVPRPTNVFKPDSVVKPPNLSKPTDVLNPDSVLKPDSVVQPPNVLKPVTPPKAVDESDSGDEDSGHLHPHNTLSISEDQAFQPILHPPQVELAAAHSSSDSVIPYRIIPTTTKSPPPPDLSNDSFSFEVLSPHSSTHEKTPSLNNDSEPILEEAPILSDDFGSNSIQSQENSSVLSGQQSEIRPFEVDFIQTEPKSLSQTEITSVPQLSISEQPPSEISEIPVLDRLRRYAQNHLRLSLSLPNGPSEQFMKYLNDVETAPPGKYLILTEDETVVVWSVLEKLHSGSRREVFELVARDTGMSPRSPIVHKIANNILIFLS
jgi:hypothetical protein